MGHCALADVTTGGQGLTKMASNDRYERYCREAIGGIIAGAPDNGRDTGRRRNDQGCWPGGGLLMF